jgi:NDP-sugar pyrophosphorylase family protein
MKAFLLAAGIGTRLPHLVGRARAVLVDGCFRDIGTVQSYHQARREWPARVSR